MIIDDDDVNDGDGDDDFNHIISNFKSIYMQKDRWKKTGRLGYNELISDDWSNTKNNSFVVSIFIHLFISFF